MKLLPSLYFSHLCALVFLVAVFTSNTFATDMDSTAAKEPAVEFYQPSHKLPNELMDSVNALYNEEVKVAVQNNQLIIRGERARVNEILEVLMQLDKPPRRFNVEISNNPGKSGAKTYSTKSRNVSQEVFTLTENIPFITVKETRAQTVNGIRPLWSRVEEIPVQQEYLQLTVKSAKEYVYVTVKMQTLQNGKFNLVNNEVSGPSYQWIAIGGNSSNVNTTGTTRTYGTNSRTPDALYIKVTPAN